MSLILGALIASLPLQGSEAQASLVGSEREEKPIVQPITVPAVPAPTITVQPASLLVGVGASATFAVTATGSGTLRYQWLKNGRQIEDANASSYAISTVGIDDAGAYSVRVSNAGGTVTSKAASLSVNVVAGTLATAPPNPTVNAGADVSLAVGAVGSGLTYKWRFNGRAISGATGATLDLANVGATSDGTYSATVSNASGVAAVAVVSLTVNIDARLTNLSARGHVGSDDEVLIVGFVIKGDGSKKVLLRAVGPTLGTLFAVPDALGTPQLNLRGYSNGQLITDTNTAWGGGAALATAFTQVGAFALPPASKDAALLETLDSGVFTGSISGVGNSTGIALAEVYDADTGSPAAELVNLSARARVGAQVADTLVAGFVISGTTSDTVLVRGVGPSLGTLFGMRKALGESQVTLYDSQGNQIAANAVWGSRRMDDDGEDEDKVEDIDDASDRVGAFKLPHGSHDSALLVTLKPGAYTAHVTGRNHTSGVALVEIYEVR